VELRTCTHTIEFLSSETTTKDTGTPAVAIDVLRERLSDTFNAESPLWRAEANNAHTFQDRVIAKRNCIAKQPIPAGLHRLFAVGGIVQFRGRKRSIPKMAWLSARVNANIERERANGKRLVRKPFPSGCDIKISSEHKKPGKEELIKNIQKGGYDLIIKEGVWGTSNFTRLLHQNTISVILNGFSFVSK
jgi:hypothetical protein